MCMLYAAVASSVRERLYGGRDSRESVAVTRVKDSKRGAARDLPEMNFLPHWSYHTFLLSQLTPRRM